MNLQNKKNLFLVLLLVGVFSYLAGVYFLNPDGKNSLPESGLAENKSSDLFHTLPDKLFIPKAMSIAPPSSFAELAKKVKPAVVNISTAKEVKQRTYNPWANDPFFRDFFGFSQRQQTPSKRAMNSLGTGFIINEQGDILTNNHVIEGADEIVVKLADGREIGAKIVGRDEKLDIAVIRPLTKGVYPYVPLGNSDGLEVGDWVVAVGNPFGLGHTVTAGIVSAKARDLGAGPYDDFIQTDASINPGNSGGPLFNVNGEVVGINTAIIASGQGIGFAIPVNLAKEAVPQLISKGSVSRGWLGVAVREMTAEEAKEFGLNKPEGALVGEVVPESPAEGAGIKPGDVITEFGGNAVKNSHALPSLVAKAFPGSKVELVFTREGKKYSRTVTVGSTEEAEGGGAMTQETKGLLGMSVRDLTSSEKIRLRLEGVVVVSVQSGTLADSVGIQEGDLLLEINGRSIGSVKELQTALSKIASGNVLRLGLARGSQMYYFAFRKE